MPALRPDVALLDVRLPDGSGVEVCRHVRTRDPSIRALMVTSFDDPDARLAAAVAGASGFLLKQINGDEVVDAVRRVARGESLTNGAATAEEIRQAAAGRDPRFASLTGQEVRILYLIADGLTNYQIGTRLRISEKTVKSHVTRLLAKLGLANRTQAAVLAAAREIRPAAERTPSASRSVHRGAGHPETWQLQVPAAVGAPPSGTLPVPNGYAGHDRTEVDVDEAAPSMSGTE